MPHRVYWHLTREKHWEPIGDFGAYSFHETKNYSMGEGGALLIRDKKDDGRSGDH